MEKRGQVYILAAIMLGVVIYSLSTIVNIVQQEEIKGDFEALSSNFEIESSKLINSVVQSGGNVPDSFVNFTFLFTSYSKSKSPGFNIFYALAYGDNLYIGNFMDEDVYIYIPCPSPSECYATNFTKGCLSNISAQINFEDLNVNLDTEWDKMFNLLKEECVKPMPIGSYREYCIDIGGFTYNFSIDPNVPKIFSLSRLKSGEQILNSIQGEVGQEQICLGRVEDNCCPDFCCWDNIDNICLEGVCSEEEEEVLGTVCKDGTPLGQCSTSLNYGPPYCCIDKGRGKIRLKQDCRPPGGGTCGPSTNYGCGCPPGSYLCKPGGGKCLKILSGP
ncbi:MAG: hypothetical protein ISS23_03435 [Nanoarchaeota archaeon]|nr:hypothetical protein [Nanoarchaeota archaeon]